MLLAEGVSLWGREKMQPLMTSEPSGRVEQRMDAGRARRAVVEYIAWYDGTRLHSSLGYRSSADYKTITTRITDE